jgi:hypothetical protein
MQEAYKARMDYDPAGGNQFYGTFTLSKKEQMKARFNQWAGSLWTKLRAVRHVLNGIGVPMLQYASYLAFGEQVWRLVAGNINGESLALEVDVLVDTWVARGLAKTTLEAIRTGVFNVGAPVAP